MCVKKDLEQLVAHKTFDDMQHLRAAVTRVVGEDVFFDKFGPPQNGVVPIQRTVPGGGSGLSCDLEARVAI